MPPVKRYDPVLQYRYIVTIEKLSDLAIGSTVGIFVAKSIELPKINFEEVEVDQRSTSFKAKGKIRYDDIQMVLYTSPGTFSAIYNWVNKHQDLESGKEGNHTLTEYVDSVKIQIQHPDGTTIKTINLMNAFVSQVDFGEMDWESSEVNLVTLTIRYDYFTM
jgi:hypothetical protein